MFCRPVVVILLMGLVNERQPLSLRCSVLYCIQCYFYKNEKSQEDVIKSLLPATGEAGIYLQMLPSNPNVGD